MSRPTKTRTRRSAAQMHALASVRREIQAQAPGRGKYLRDFSQAFRSFDRILTPEDIQSRISAADIILIGDYHALPQSQRFAANLIERLSERRPVVLGVEAVLARDQRILDAWWRREISEEELRRRLRFDREWGYDWLPFYELLSSARDRAEGLYALDCEPRHDLRRIRSRDRHAAAKIHEIRMRHPRAATVILFGESHMAPDHLPRALREELPNERALIVLQNVDTLYWQTVANEIPPAVAIGTDVICVFNSTPVEKYESFRLCLEKWQGDDQLDFAPAVYNLISSLASSFGFRLDSPHNGSQPQYLADCFPEVVTVEEDPGEFQVAEQLVSDQIQTALEEKGCAYIPDTNTFLIREFKMSCVAAEAARFLHHACLGFPAERNQALETALVHFGSRLLCPATGPEPDPSDNRGEELYQSYLAGKLSNAALRSMFLGRKSLPR